MNQLLGDLVDICVLVDLDDILIFSHTEEYQKHVCIVLTGNISSNTMFVQKRKNCELFSKKVEFLDHTVSAAGVGVV